MAGDDRTEKATPRRREEARKKGQIARSSDLGGALVLVAGMMTIAFMGTDIAESAAGCLRAMLTDISHPQLVATTAGLSELLHDALDTAAITLGPVAGACLLAGLISGVAQSGGRPRPQALKLDFQRLSPIHGIKNLFGPNMIFETLKTLAKVGVVAAVVGITLIPGITGLAAKVGIPPLALGALSGGRALEVAERAAFTYLLIGILDYAWQRRRHERSLRMTRQEVKDELREHNVSGELKAAQRRRAQQAARARMMAAVPNADVVVTNPTHFAVALRYDGSQSAPEVVAKGQDLIAAQIRRVAEEHDVPVVGDPPLARALHASTEIGQVIPAELYMAVARVLAFVYRIAGRTAATAAAGRAR